jgi:hypothetical protein
MPNSKTTERELYLLSLKPSSNLEAELWNVKKKIFKEEGFLSALALPPLIPLGWNQNPVSKEVFFRIRNIGLPPLLYRGYRKSGNIISGLAEPAEAIEKLLRWTSVDGPLNIVPGIFLAVDESGNSGKTLKGSALFPETGYTGFMLWLIRMQFDPERSDWWGKFRWECLLSGRMKKIITSPEDGPE